MIGLVFVTHGNLALEFVAAMEHVVGKQTQVDCVCIGPDDDMEARRQEILQKTKVLSIMDKTRRHITNKFNSKKNAEKAKTLFFT